MSALPRACRREPPPYTGAMQKVFFAALLCLCAITARAQVNVEVVFEQAQFLRNESLPVRLRISNFSGQPLHLGGTDDWLEFTVVGMDGKSVGRRAELPPARAFTIESSKTISLSVDLMPCFNLGEPGRYNVSAKISVPQIGKTVGTDPNPFDIVTGTDLWAMDVGVPGTTPPVIRKYTLQQATFLKQPRLYVRLTDETQTHVLRVLPIGNLLSFSKPEALVDQSSNLHVLFQNGPRTFLYSVVTPAGDVIIRQSHDLDKTHPHLRSEDDGRVVVAGGERRFLLSDLPPPRVADSREKTESK